ncbi:MAG TPA: PH domain-containing protein, partial [Herpetosiphonaceae bacterium]|nr:PH domain-containing protein [Herpetosiphonaceae bacterium]
QRDALIWGLGLIAVLVLGSGIFDFLRWRNERFLLTDRRVIHLRGVINKSTIDSSLDKINDVQTRQTFFGRMFNYGDLEIQTASEDGSNFLPQIRSPLDFKRAMLNAKADHDRPVAAYQNTPSIAAYQNPAPPAQRLTQLQVEEMLMRLNDLRQKNLINDADFEAKKREILSQM